MRKLYCALLFLAVLASCGRSRQSASATAEQFYRARIGSGLSGAPNPAQLTQISPFLSSELVDLLKRARQLHDEEERRAPDEKPPFAEGDLFSSLFEGPSSFHIESEQPGQGGAVDVVVSFRYKDSSPSPEVKWTDTVNVSRENGRPVISDIHYGGNWAFGNKGRLTDALRRELQPADPHKK